MKFVFYTNSVSPHQLPLARELVARLGADNYRYIYTTPQTAERRDLGWGLANERWIVCEKDDPKACRDLLDSCEVLMSGIREFALFAKRAAGGKKTIYSSERWFKPIPFGRFLLPGAFRLLHPRYFSYARKVAALIRHDDNFFCYPMGVWAQRDMEFICRMFRVPHNRIRTKLHLWGYFVAPSERVVGPESFGPQKPFRVLWLGRMVYWKRVDTLIRAVSASPGITLDIYGTGPMERTWRRLAEGLCSGQDSASIIFHPPVQITSVRDLMRSHDVYVLASNAEEGWGAVVNEAMEEHMRVIGTFEAGASATVLPRENLYHAGDWRHLAQMLSLEVPYVDVGIWNARSAAERLVGEMGI